VKKVQFGQAKSFERIGELVIAGLIILVLAGHVTKGEIVAYGRAAADEVAIYANDAHSAVIVVLCQEIGHRLCMIKPKILSPSLPPRG
jgi:hypothetical protein